VQAFLGPGCADAWSPKTLRSGAGAQFGMQVRSDVDLPGLVQSLNLQKVHTLAMEVKASQDYTDVKPGPQGSLVLVGSEGKGLPGALASLCSHRVKISYPGPVESLNAGVAGSILLFEIYKKAFK
jgi:TrmH family RNA methyltransferase